MNKAINVLHNLYFLAFSLIDNMKGDPTEYYEMIDALDIIEKI